MKDPGASAGCFFLFYVWLENVVSTVNPPGGGAEREGHLHPIVQRSRLSPCKVAENLDLQSRSTSARQQSNLKLGRRAGRRRVKVQLRGRTECGVGCQLGVAGTKTQLKEPRRAVTERREKRESRFPLCPPSFSITLNTEC